MIRGINSQPYINLDPFINMDEYQCLQYKIYKGVVLTKRKTEGNMNRPGGFDGSPVLSFKPIFQAVAEYEALPESHEIRVEGSKIKDRDQFIRFLKLALGAYDPYQYIYLKTPEEWREEVQHFPELVEWLNSLVGPVFKQLDRIMIFRSEHDVQMPFHKDLYFGDGNDYFDHKREFIHLRPDLDKPFYIWNNTTDEKILVESRATFFNDQDWHAGGKVNKQTVSIRVDGPFTDEFRDRIGLTNIEHY